MSADLERELLARWSQDRDPQARDRLVASQQRLVFRLARRHASNSQPVSDLVQEGNLGLLHALSRFDPERAVRLATYAAWWVRAYILRYVERNRGLVRGATTADRTRVYYQLARTRQRLAAQGQEPTREAIASALGVDERDIEAMELLSTPATSLDTPPRDDDRPSRGIDRVADTGPTPEQAVQAVEMKTRLSGALARFGDRLKGREREMFERRLGCTRPASLRELSEAWGVTRAAVARVEAQVSRPLQRFLYREMGDAIMAVLGHA